MLSLKAQPINAMLATSAQAVPSLLLLLQKEEDSALLASSVLKVLFKKQIVLLVPIILTKDKLPVSHAQ